MEGKSHFQFDQNSREESPEKTYIATAYTTLQIFHTKTTQNRMNWDQCLYLTLYNKTAQIFYDFS